MPASCPIFSPPITTPAALLKAGTRRRHNACMTDLLAHHTRSGGQWRVVDCVRNAVPAPVNHGQPWAVEPIQTTNIGVLVSRPRSSPPSRADGGGNQATDKQRSTNKDLAFKICRSNQTNEPQIPDTSIISYRSPEGTVFPFDQTGSPIITDISY